MRYRYIFGPVHSRRLGISLGVDPLLYKTCTMSCVYCENGPTAGITLEQKEYNPVEEIKEELESYLKNKPALDYITFSGMGEPTLHSSLGKLTGFIKDNFPGYRVAVLTNGTLLYRREVKEWLARADLVDISLDAVSPETWQAINRPHALLNVEGFLRGLVAFRREYCGELVICVLVVPGLNDGRAEVEKIKQALIQIKPDRVNVGTVDRAPAEPWVEEAGRELLEYIAAKLGGEVI